MSSNVQTPSRTQQSFRSAIIFCIVGAAASGKTTLIAKLRAEFPDSTRRSVSVTSRSMRPGEVEGESYYFVSRSEFEKKVATNEFFEWEETHGNLYGTLRSNIEQMLKASSDIVLDIDIRGALNFRRSWSDRVVIILIVPPSGKELIHRLRSRGSISAQELQARVQTAQQEYETFRQLHQSGDDIDYLVINHDLEEAYATMRSIVLTERSRFARQSQEFINSLCTVEKVTS